MTIRAALARGFTLIEMAIVTVVVGLVLSGGLVAVAPVIQNSHTSETNQKLDRIEQALILYVMRNGCLPCPADPTLSSGTTNSGKAHGTTYYVSSCTTACNATVSSQGVVPWVTLGLSEADTTDGWGTRIDYAVTAALVATSGMVRTPPSSYPSGTLTVNDTSGLVEQTGGAGNRAAYVLVSHGPDKAFGYASTTGTGPGADSFSSTVEQANRNGGPFRQGDWITTAASRTSATYFDDLVRWRSAPIIIQLCGTNACGNPA